MQLPIAPVKLLVAIAVPEFSSHTRPSCSSLPEFTSSPQNLLLMWRGHFLHTPMGVALKAVKVEAACLLYGLLQGICHYYEQQWC